MVHFSFGAVCFVVFTATVIGHPHLRLSRPLGFVETNQPRLESRASRDPACPDGYLCEQDSCSSDVKCPTGTVCISLEGTVACATPSLQWCALNPTTFEAVGCSLDGLCCHGNCYVGNAVCCDNPGTVCTVGNLCGACNPGQTCGNNGACLGGGNPTTASQTATSTTTKISISSTIPTNPSTSLTSTTVNPTTTATTITSGGTATTALPSPTVVSSVDPFANPSCFVDITDSRILLNGTSVDQSATGMTVEKCVELSDGWRYAGVEFKGECYWGDILQSDSDSPLDQCDMACAGDATEICGGGNRILIYGDTTWTNPTRDDLADALTDYNTKAAAFHDLVQTWQDQITQYNQQNPDTKRAILANAVGHLFGRQVQIPITLEIIAQTRAQALAARQILVGLGKLVNTLFRTASNYVKINQGEYNDWIQLRSAVEEEAAEIATDALIDLTLAAARNAALEILGGVLKLIGNPLTIVEGTAFFLIKSLINLLRSSGGTNPSQPPITPTPTPTTATTSTTSTSTAVPTPFVIITKEGTTSSQFDGLVKTFPPDDRNLDISQASVNLFMIIAYINQTFAGELASNAIIECMALEVFADADSVEWSDGTGTVIPLPDDGDPDFKRDLHAAINESILLQRATGPQDLILQRSAPNHLQWLSRVDRNGNAAYRFDAAYLYAQQTPQENPLIAPDIYIVDSGINKDHQDFADVLGSGKSFISKWLARHAVSPPPGATTTIQDDNGHGTCMASVAGGKFCGSIKNANIIPVKVDIQTQFIPSGQDALRASSMSITDGLGWILATVNERNQQGRSVVSISQTFDGARLWPAGLQQPPSTNPLKTLLDRLFDAGVVVLASAGNNAVATANGPGLLADQRTPADLSSPSYPLIVVGGVGSDNRRNTFSEIGSTAGIVSIYGYGGLQFCAQKTETNVYRGSQGTSQATAQVAGLAASFIALSGDQLPANLPDIPLFMKNKLREIGSTFKGSQPVGEGSNGIAPLASNGLFVGCVTANTDPTIVGTLLTPAFFGVLNSIDKIVSKVVGRPTAPDITVINKVGFCTDLTTTSTLSV